jgi:hypothetical protein
MYPAPKRGLLYQQTTSSYTTPSSKVNEQKTVGKYELNFDAGNLASGVYIYRIQVIDYVSSRKMMLLK